MKHSRWLPILFVSLVGAAACTDERKIDVASSIVPSRMPTMTTENVSTLISDSGVVKYKIVAPVWKVYEEVDTPYWIFPKGIYLQQYDPYFKVVATVAADSAKFFQVQKLWLLQGNVEVTRPPADLFYSQRLYWDQRRARVYSDTFIHIENATHVLEGIGFESNDKFTVYRVLKPQGIFPVNSSDL